MIESLIATVLPVETCLMHDPQCDPRDRRHDSGPCYRGRYLRRGNNPEALRDKDDCGGNDSEDAGDDDKGPFVRRRVDHRACWRGHDHARDAADGHHGTDQAAFPATGQQKHAQERTNARLYVSHKEVQ